MAATKVFVGNLAFTTTDEELRSAFAGVGGNMYESISLSISILKMALSRLSRAYGRHWTAADPFSNCQQRMRADSSAAFSRPSSRFFSRQTS
jgi:RNA recognition motif-containing protein